MENVRRQKNRVAQKSEAKPVKNKVKPRQIITMVVTLIVAVFVVIQVIHMVNYTLGRDMDINKMWLYKWLLTVTQK